jgi:hypothetical protein
VLLSLAGSSQRLASQKFLATNSRSLSFTAAQKDLPMLGFVAAVLFVIAFLINATSTSTSAVFSPTSLLLVGLACLALHLAGIGTGWSVPGRRKRR